MSLPASGVLMGLGAAFGLGVGDFLGGFATKRRAVLRVVLAAHGFGLAGIALVVAITRPPLPSLPTVALAGIAGWVGAGAMLAFYAALSRGRMGAASTLSALLSALVPVVWDWTTRGGPTAIRGLGVVVALGAITLLTKESGRTDRGTLGLAALAGLGFGTFLVLLAEAGSVSGTWPVMLTRVFSLALLIPIAWRTPLGGAPGVPWVGAAAGLFDTAANLVFVVGSQRANLDVVSVLAAMYPVFTIALAITVLRERPTAWQWAGVAVALVAVVLLQV